MCVCVVCFLFYINKKSFLYTTSKNHARCQAHTHKSVNRERGCFHTIFSPKLGYSTNQLPYIDELLVTFSHKLNFVYFLAKDAFLFTFVCLSSVPLPLLFCARMHLRGKTSCARTSLRERFVYRFVLACKCVCVCVFSFSQFSSCTRVYNTVTTARSYREEERKSFRNGRGREKREGGDGAGRKENN